MPILFRGIFPVVNFENNFSAEKFKRTNVVLAIRIREKT